MGWVHTTQAQFCFTSIRKRKSYPLTIHTFFRLCTHTSKTNNNSNYTMHSRHRHKKIKLSYQDWIIYPSEFWECWNLDHSLEKWQKMLAILFQEKTKTSASTIEKGLLVKGEIRWRLSIGAALLVQEDVRCLMLVERTILSIVFSFIMNDFLFKIMYSLQITSNN